MTIAQAKKLKVGDAVRFKIDWTSGIVREKDYGNVRIEWADGELSLWPLRDNNADLWKPVEVLR